MPKTFLISNHFFGFTLNLYEKVSTDHSICDLTEQIRHVIAFVSMLFFPLQYKEPWSDWGCTTQQTRRLFFHYMTDNDQWMLQHYCNLQSLRLDTTTSCTHFPEVTALQITEYCWVHLEGVSCLCQGKLSIRDNTDSSCPYLYYMLMTKRWSK